jgi:nucleolar protein 6
LERPQRYSATSGVDQAPTAKRTWSIADEKDTEIKTRGKKKSKRPPKPLGTGVNAIPVG